MTVVVSKNKLHSASCWNSAANCPSTMHDLSKLLHQGPIMMTSRYRDMPDVYLTVKLLFLLLKQHPTVTLIYTEHANTDTFVTLQYDVILGKRYPRRWTVRTLALSLLVTGITVRNVIVRGIMVIAVNVGGITVIIFNVGGITAVIINVGGITIISIIIGGITAIIVVVGSITVMFGIVSPIDTTPSEVVR